MRINRERIRSSIGLAADDHLTLAATLLTQTIYRRLTILHQSEHYVQISYITSMNQDHAISTNMFHDANSPIPPMLTTMCYKTTQTLIVDMPCRPTNHLNPIHSLSKAP